MANYNPYDWYWLADDGRVFASARQVIVDETDPDYIAWIVGNTATAWPRDLAGNQTNDALQEVLTPYGLYCDLSAYAANARLLKETGGIVVDGIPVPTDRDMQARITSGYVSAQANSNWSTTWKQPDGSFITITAGQMIAIAQAVSAHVAACAAAEQQADAAIIAGTCTTQAEVDAFFVNVEPLPPDLGTTPPRVVASAFNISVADGVVTPDEVPFNIGGVIYIDVGQYWGFFATAQPDDAYFAVITGGAASMTITDHTTDFFVIEAKDSAGVAVDPTPQFSVQIMRLA